MLYQNQPNPLRGNTSIRYALPLRGHVRLEVFDISGKKVRTLVNRIESAGKHSATWDGRDTSGNPVASGVYYYRLRMGGKTLTRSCSLLR
jgi:hypothetical protein